MLCWTSYLQIRKGLSGMRRSKAALAAVMVEFRILKGGRRTKSKITTLGFRRADLTLFRGLPERVL